VPPVSSAAAAESAGESRFARAKAASMDAL
jgi:hypothetical protein